MLGKFIRFFQCWACSDLSSKTLLSERCSIVPTEIIHNLYAPIHHCQYSNQSFLHIMILISQ